MSVSHIHVLVQGPFPLVLNLNCIYIEIQITDVNTYKDVAESSKIDPQGPNLQFGITPYKDFVRLKGSKS